MHLIRQPEGQSLCGQACVAMAAGISLEQAVEAVGHGRLGGTHTYELVAAFDKLGISCARRCRRTKHVAGLPVLPPRAIIAIRRNAEKHLRRWHWMLWFDGEMFDPDGLWPGFYADWTVTSFLEIYTCAELPRAA